MTTSFIPSFNWQNISEDDQLSAPSSIIARLRSIELNAFFTHNNILFDIADSVQTEYCTTFLLSVCSCVTGVTSHISHIYKGINAMWIIRGPIKPYILWIKIILAIFLAKTRPDKTIFSALTNLTIDFDFKLSEVKMLNPHCLLCLVLLITCIKKLWKLTLEGK